MAFGLDTVRRLFHAGCDDKKPTFESQRQVYDFCRSNYRTSGGPNKELRDMYANYRRTSSKRVDDRLGVDSRKKLPQAL